MNIITQNGTSQNAYKGVKMENAIKTMNSCENCKYSENCYEEEKEVLGFLCENFEQYEHSAYNFFKYELKANARKRKKICSKNYNKV